jgi:hypothetical protein
MYALILLDHAGNDLESWKMRNWRESKEIWDQVVRQLGDAEKEFQFEVSFFFTYLALYRAHNSFSYPMNAAPRFTLG